MPSVTQSQLIAEIVETRDLNRITPAAGFDRPFIFADAIAFGSNAGWGKSQAAKAERDGAPWDAISPMHGTTTWSRWSEIPNATYAEHLLMYAVDRGLATIA